MSLDPSVDPLLGIVPLANQVPLRRRQAAYPAMPEEEARPLLDHIVNAGTGGLHYLASTLGKPDRAFRGLLSGDAREALSILPFSDSLGITDPSQEHTTDEIMQRLGLVSKNDPSKWEARDFTVPLMDVLTSPTTYIGLAPLTQAGKAARAAGTLTKGLGASIAAGERGIIGFGKPFAESTKVFGAGSKLGTTLGTGIDKAGSRLLDTALVRHARALLDPNAGRSSVRFIQDAFANAGRPLADKLMAEGRAQEFGTRQFLRDTLQGAPLGAESEALRLMRQSAESIPSAKDQLATIQSLVDRHNLGLLPKRRSDEL